MDTPPTETLRVKRSFRLVTVAKYLLFLLVCITLLIASAYLIVNHRGQRVWEAELRRLEEQGLPLEVGSMIPPMPPDEENFAMAPVMIPIFDFSTGSDSDPYEGDLVWNQPDAYNALKNLGGFLKGLDRGPDWMTGHPIDLEEIESELADDSRETGGDATRLQSFPRLRGELASLQRTLEQIDFALERPHSQFPVAHEDGPHALMPHLPILRDLSFVYTIRATLALADGNADEAFCNIASHFALAKSISGEPQLISLVIRSRMIRQALHPVWEGLRTRAFSETRLQTLQEIIAEIELLPHMERALTGQRFFAWMFIDGFPYSDTPPDAVVVPPRLMPTGWKKRNKAIASRMMEIHFKALFDPASRRFFPERFDAVADRVEAEFTHAIDHHLSRGFFSNIIALRRPVATQTSVDLAVLAVAVERFRLHHGRLPSDLNELVPAYLDEVRWEITSEREYGYRVQEDNVVLYSTWLDQTDDRGNAVARSANTHRAGSPALMRTRGDLVWSYQPVPEFTEE